MDVFEKIIEFSWYDYALFGFILSLSTAIGIYFGYFNKKEQDANEYLLGSNEMTVFPVSMSLISSYISGITLLAVPADIYLYGSNYCTIIIALIIVGFLTCYIYLPVFYKIKLTSIYEYLELRFDKRNRIIASILFSVSVLLYLPIVIYIPALAFSQATGFNVHILTPIICGICIFYTTIGGIKAVIWTDTLQFIMMIGGIVAVIAIGIAKVGGVNVLISESIRGERLFTDFDISLFKRDMFWTCVIGTTFHCATALCNQGFIQKFMSLPSLKEGKTASVIFTIGTVLINITSLLIGLIMYVTYKDQDPFTSGIIHKLDELLPYFVLNVAGHIPGLPGIFIAGIVCAALSTLSAMLNALAASMFKDFVTPFLPKGITEKSISKILKLMVTVIGIFTTIIVYVIEHFGGLLSLQLSLNAITLGPILGLFTLGMFMPRANRKGAFYGLITTVTIMCWIVFGAQYYQLIGQIRHPTRPLRNNNQTFYSTNPNDVNLTNLNGDVTRDEPFFIYRISHYYYSPIGFTLMILLGTIISYFTNDEETDTVVDPDLITPCMQRFIPKENKHIKYHTVENALKQVVHDKK